MDSGDMDSAMDAGDMDSAMNDGSTGDGSMSGDGSGGDGAASDGGAGDGGCDSVMAPWHYLVDPVNGSDAMSSTGSGTSGGNAAPACAFKTITHAIQQLLLANNPPQAGTQIIVQGPSTVSVQANGETFPIKIPQNVLITSTGGAVKVVVTSGDAFLMAATGSGLDSLTIDGSANSGARALVADTGTDLTDKITNVSITSFAQDCVALTNKGVLTVGDGVTVTGCGTMNARHSGFYATGNAYLKIAPSNKQVLIGKNTEYGIKVDTAARLDVTSSLGNMPPNSALVLVDSNALGGVFVQQMPNPNNPPPLCTVDGIAVSSSTGVNGADGDGIRVYGGSIFKLRNSWVLKNLSNGIHVLSYPQNVLGASDVSGIDLGASSQDYGKNRVQDQNSFNGAAGICLDLSQALNQNLKALGNMFASNIDCSQMMSMLSKGMCAANSKTHVGIAGSQMNTISTSMCTN
jgi:hypothetical protein